MTNIAVCCTINDKRDAGAEDSMADRTDVLNKDEIEEYKRQITQARNEENKRQAEFRVKYSFKAPEFVAHATHVSQEEFKSSVGEIFAKYPADTDLVPAFSKGTQNEFNAEKSVKGRFDGDKLRALGRFVPYPERVFALATKQDEKGNPILDEQGRPVPQDGSYAYSLKKCCASINVVDDEIPLLIGFEERYADFESGEKTGHIYIGKGKDFKAEYDEHGNITEYTSDKEMVVTHHYKTTPKDAMEHNVQLVMFGTEADYEKWATEVRNKRNKFATFIYSDDIMIKLLQEEIAAGRATYINATERGFNPKITALQTARENINRTDKSQEFANADKITVAEPSAKHYRAFLTACREMQDYIENPNTPDDIGKSVSRGFIFAKKEFLSLSEDEFKTKIVEEYAKRSQDGAAKPEYFRFILVGDKIAGYVNARAMARDEFDVKYGLESCKKWDYISEHGARACISDVLLPEYRGKGIIGKAQKLFFDELRKKGINEVSATVLSDNASSNRAHNKMLDDYGGRTYQVHGDPDGKGVQYFNRYIINTDTSSRQKDNFKEEIKAVLSDHFDEIKQPVSVSLGLHLRGQTVENVVNLLRKDGINAIPYYDAKVQDDLSCFVVDGTGIRSPFMPPDDAVKAAADMARIMLKNKIETSRAMPITKASLVPAVSERYTGSVIDIAKNNPTIPNVKETLSEYLQYAAEKMPAIAIPDTKSNTRIYSGRLFADAYALTPHRRYRDCVYATNMFSEALTYSQAANKGGLHLEEINGRSYGFIIELKQPEKQKFYDMAGAERPFASREERQTAKRKENRDDYETLVLEDRNPVTAMYLRIGNDKVVQIADENGFFNKDGIDWEKFALLHKPRDTNEPNDYMVARINKQIEEFPIFAYEKQNDLGEYQPTADIKGYAYKELIKENADGFEINNASFHSLKLSENMCKTNFTGNVSLINCTVAENQTLELGHCDGDISFSHMTYDNNIHLPEQCGCFSLSCVKLPPCDELDLSQSKCQNITLEASDLTAVKSLELPQSDELKLRYNVKMPEKLDLSGIKTIIFDQTAKLDLVQTKEIKATGFDVAMRSRDEKDPINRLVDGYTMKICSLLPEWNHSEAGKDAEAAKQKLNFAAKMTQLKAFLHEKNITDEKQILRAMDLVIAKNVPDEHVRIVIDGEEHRAAHQAIAKDDKLQYKIPPQEKHNLLNSAKTFHKQQLFTLVAPSKPDEIVNILVAEKKIGNRTVGIVAVDSFMIEYGNADVLKKVDKIADYVLEQSKNWNDVVFDFRGNGGGDASIIKQIGERMSGKKLAYADKTEIIDKALTDRGGPPEQYMQKANDKTFTGNVYVLQDGGNSSAADGAIWMLRQTDNYTTVGENTFGAFAGGDVKKHKIEGGTLLIGNTYRERYLPDGTKVEEGKGIPPDIKCASENAYDMAITLVKKTNMQMYSLKTDKANLSANQRDNMQIKTTLKTLADIKRDREYNH